MAYQVLARKWRPTNFTSLVGQGPIVTALTNALTERRIAQAYLFSGIRGVGKTSSARLLAKALNCEQGPTATPCEECHPCREIPEGSDLDVLEIDAATYSKVEQVRELTESLRYGSARDRYKVVVIDEIHRLSRQAFDALLKIVEEPPDHLVFIFATTEIEAVPATILSRCQEFRFRRVAAGELAEHLRTICDAEKIEASDAALRLVARAGEGSVRDSVALLDQLATFGSGTIRDEDAARLAGSLDVALFAGLLGAIINGDAEQVVAAVRTIDEEGWDPRHVYSQFLAYCRDALHVSMGGDTDSLDLPADDATALGKIASGAGYENLLRLLHLLLGSESTVRRSEAGALAVEIAWLRAAELPKLTRIEEILAGGSGSIPSVSPSTAKPAAAKARPAPKTTPRPALTKKAPVTPDPAPAPTPTPTSRPAKPEPVASPTQGSRVTGEPAAAPSAPQAPPKTASPSSSDPLAALLEEISRRKQPLAAYLQEAQKLCIEKGKLLIYSAPGDSLLTSALERKGNREILDAALDSVAGAPKEWQLLAGVDTGTKPTVDSKEDTAEAEVSAEHPTVQAVLDIFGGTVTGVDTDTTQED